MTFFYDLNIAGVTARFSMAYSLQPFDLEVLPETGSRPIFQDGRPDLGKGLEHECRIHSPGRKTPLFILANMRATMAPFFFVLLSRLSL